MNSIQNFHTSNNFVNEVFFYLDRPADIRTSTESFNGCLKSNQQDKQTR